MAVVHAVVWLLTVLGETVASEEFLDEWVFALAADHQQGDACGYGEGEIEAVVEGDGVVGGLDMSEEEGVVLYGESEGSCGGAVGRDVQRGDCPLAVADIEA